MTKFVWYLMFIIGIMISLVVVGIYQIYQGHNTSYSENHTTEEKDNHHLLEIINDSSGIPLVYYGNTTGYQRNPVTTSLVLIDYYNAYVQTKNITKLQYLQNNANWLVVNAKQYGNYSLFEYEFPYRYNLNPPWHSALAQGLAIQSLTKAYQITKNATYLDATKPLLNSFYVDVNDNGITEKTNSTGWWYEEYTGKDSKNPRVLNGMMLDLLALYDYYNYTGNTKSKYLFNQGVLGLKNNISIYDDNGSSYYDAFKLPATLFYQKLHVDLLDKLYNLTGEPILKKYHDRWESHMQSRENNTASVKI